MNISEIKKRIFIKDLKKLMENFFSLTILQLSNYLIPLITLPYLKRVLGDERFGLTGFALYIMQYFIMFTDFGFNLSATRDISINRNNPEKVSRIFFSVYIIKISLLLISALIMFLMITFVGRFREERMFYYYSFLSVAGAVVFPQWFYQGLEKMKFITIFTLGAKTFFTILMFFLIKNSDDYLWQPILNSTGYFVSGVVAFLFSFSLYKIQLIAPSLQEIKQQFIDGWHIFVSNVSINLYTTSNGIILGLFTTNVIVGYYFAAERVFKAFQLIGMPLFQALFPHFSKLIIDDRVKAIRHFTKLFRITVVSTLIMSLILSVSAPFLMKVYLGPTAIESGKLLSILSWVIFASWGNYCLGIQGLVNFGYEKIFARIVLTFGLLHILLIYFAIKWFGFYAAPCVWFLTESMIFLTEYIYIKSKKILI